MDYNYPIHIHCDIDQLINEFEVRIWTSEFVSLVEDESIPILAIYAVEYMLTRKTDILILITTFCMANKFHQQGIINIFRDVVDNSGYLTESFHNHFDIYNHYVYLKREDDVVVITLRDTPDESSVALISPEDDEYDDN